MTFIFQWPIGYLQQHQALYGGGTAPGATAGTSMGLLLALTYAA